MDSYSIAQNFAQYFQIKFADSEQLKQEVYKIRYSVYAKELGWEPENEIEIETDEYDSSSYHCLIEHRRTATFAGCVRLIAPLKGGEDVELPFEKYCLHTARTNIIDSTQMPRGSFGEISRLAVLSSFRRRKNEQNVPFVVQDTSSENVYSEQEKRNFPNLAIGLYLAAVALSDLCALEGMFVMMEPRLNRRLNRFGLPFIQCGDELDYHGRRAMFFLNRAGFFSQLTPELLDLYLLIKEDLSNQFNAKLLDTCL